MCCPDLQLDAQMSYKAALAYHATRDVRYARVVFDTVNAWAATNKAWGMASQNGPLEAGALCSVWMWMRQQLSRVGTWVQLCHSLPPPPPKQPPAGWGVAALARSLEVLRTLPEFGASRTAFNTWYYGYVHPQVDAYVSNSANVAKGGNLNVYGNCA
jgi:hypothetical protein